MNSEQSFGQLVKARRRELGLTQDELARRVGCAPVTIRKIEYDDLRPSVQIAERLAMALNVTLEERAAFVRLARVERAPLVEPTPTPVPSRKKLARKTSPAVPFAAMRWGSASGLAAWARSTARYSLWSSGKSPSRSSSPNTPTTPISSAVSKPKHNLSPASNIRTLSRSTIISASRAWRFW